MRYRIFGDDHGEGQASMGATEDRMHSEVRVQNHDDCTEVQRLWVDGTDRSKVIVAEDLGVDLPVQYAVHSARQ